MNIARIRPSKPISAITATLATVFACVGLAGIVAVFGWFPQAWPVGLFLCLWTFATGLIAIFHWINALSASGVSMLDTEIQSTSNTNSTTNRLKELDTLNAQNLISSEEYRLKREDILKKL